MLTYTMGGPSIDAGAPCGDPRILRYTPPVPEFEVPITATARRLWPPLACERPAGVGRRCLASTVRRMHTGGLALPGAPCSLGGERGALPLCAVCSGSSYQVIMATIGPGEELTLPRLAVPAIFIVVRACCSSTGQQQASSRPAAGQQGCRHVAVGCEVAPSLTAPGSICTRWRGRETRSRRAGRRPSLCGPGGATTCQRVPTRSRCVCMPRRRVH